jgi:hypothetical protein
VHEPNSSADRDRDRGDLLHVAAITRDMMRRGRRCFFALCLCVFASGASAFVPPAAHVSLFRALTSSAMSPQLDPAACRRTTPSARRSGLAASVRMASGVDMLPLGAQAAVFAGIMSSIALFGLALAGPILDSAERALPVGWFDAWAKTWPLLGFVYVFAGTAHFSSAAAFEAIYPPLGTWGLWYLPGSAAFHVVLVFLHVCKVGAWGRRMRARLSILVAAPNAPLSNAPPLLLLGVDWCRGAPRRLRTPLGRAHRRATTGPSSAGPGGEPRGQGRECTSTLLAYARRDAGQHLHVHS